MNPLVPSKELETTTVTLDEIVYHRRVRVLDHAEQTSIEACRTFGISRTTYYRWADQARCYGLAALMPKARPSLRCRPRSRPRPSRWCWPKWSPRPPSAPARAPRGTQGDPVGVGGSSKKRLRHFRHDLPSGVETGRNVVVVEPGCGHEHDLGPHHLPIRQRIPAGPRFELGSLLRTSKSATLRSVHTRRPDHRAESSVPRPPGRAGTRWLRESHNYCHAIRGLR